MGVAGGEAGEKDGLVAAEGVGAVSGVELEVVADEGGWR